jgi:hypothetical protein
MNGHWRPNIHRNDLEAKTIRKTVMIGSLLRILVSIGDFDGSFRAFLNRNRLELNGETNLCLCICFAVALGFHFESSNP